MITQETKPVKTWGGFNLTILSYPQGKLESTILKESKFIQ